MVALVALIGLLLTVGGMIWGFSAEHAGILTEQKSQDGKIADNTRRIEILEERFNYVRNSLARIEYALNIQPEVRSP